MVEIRALASDAVIDIDGEVLLLERDHPPFDGHWVLAGGLVEPGETAREACVREVAEEVGIDVTVQEFVGLYDDPDRDERGNVSAAYRCLPVGNATPEPREEARRVNTFAPRELPETGFDHGRIIRDAFGQ
ncbi:NUDIX family hydrolase [Halalkaliarchaeum sp. AArc-CO]|uniref:NUDIX hydrolase n=1 Tax=unclassified Halalkaliarchaeum TaxID=2678344 RepID=UPI00217DE908|nr:MULTISPECIES: NUDIX hydrolase [unclassified Halalkaliarchaeum]MDR5674119.1 NUDIX hydrolase [Halalkaliarchaeum sp. AArc-GB]UWG50838.1 NUDIX family hydrolase [Halalkaliarchaeum sp. AArc-CO]